MKPATTRVARLAMDRGWCVGWGEVGRYVCGGWHELQQRVLTVLGFKPRRRPRAYASRANDYACEMTEGDLIMIIL